MTTGEVRGIHSYSDGPLCFQKLNFVFFNIFLKTNILCCLLSKLLTDLLVNRLTSSVFRTASVHCYNVVYHQMLVHHPDLISSLPIFMLYKGSKSVGSYCKMCGGIWKFWISSHLGFLIFLTTTGQNLACNPFVDFLNSLLGSMPKRQLSNGNIFFFGLENADVSENLNIYFNKKARLDYLLYLILSYFI